MPKKLQTGRPTLISKTIIADICNALRAGAYIETAAALSGINKSTLYEWLKRGKQGSQGLHVEFSNAVKKAMAESELRDLINIDNAAMGQKEEYERYPEGTVVNDPVTGLPINISGSIVTMPNGKPVLKRVGIAPDWGASAWRLERKFPQRWAKTEKSMDISDHDEIEGSQKVINVNFVKPTKK